MLHRRRRPSGWCGAEGFKTLTIGPSTQLSISLDLSLFLFALSAAMAGCAHHGAVPGWLPSPVFSLSFSLTVPPSTLTGRVRSQLPTNGQWPVWCHRRRRLGRLLLPLRHSALILSLSCVVRRLGLPGTLGDPPFRVFS